MFGRRSKGTEVCKLSRKLLRICHGWVDEEAKGQCSFCHGDEFKIRKNVLEREYPNICESLISVLGEYKMKCLGIYHRNILQFFFGLKLS